MTWGNWLAAAPIEVWKNDAPVAQANLTSINRSKGTFKAGVVDVGADNRARDTVNVTYWFDYFWPDILEGFLTETTI